MTTFKYAAPGILAFLLLLVAPVGTRAVEIPADSLANAAVRALEAAFSGPGLRVEVDPPKAFPLAIEGDRFPLIRVQPLTDRRYGASVPVTIDLVNDGVVVRSVRLLTRVRFFAEVVVVSSAVARGEQLNESALTIDMVDITGLDGFYTDPARVAGFETKRAIRSGTVLTEAMVRPQCLIRRGDAVVVEVRNMPVIVRTEGVARSDGGEGEDVKVYIDMTRATVTGRVVDSGTVVIEKDGGAL